MFLKGVYKGVIHIRRIPHPPEISFSASMSDRDLKIAPDTLLWPSLTMAFLNLQDMCLKGAFKEFPTGCD